MEVCINSDGVRKQVDYKNSIHVMELRRIKSSITQWISDHKSTSKQQVCVSDKSFLRHAKNWTHTPSTSGSYGRQASRPSGRQKPCCILGCIKIFVVDILPATVMEILLQFYRHTNPIAYNANDVRSINNLTYT